MKRLITKSEISLSINNDVIKMVDDKFKNRSKFIQCCIIQELIKDGNYKEKIDNIIL